MDENFLNAGVIRPGMTWANQIKDLESPFVIIRDASPDNFRMVRETFPESLIYQWNDHKDYESYSGKKYRDAGIVYAEEYIRAKKLVPKTVMAYSSAGPPVEVRISDLDRSCIALEGKKLRRICKMLNNTARDYLFVENSTNLGNSKCVTVEAFLSEVASEKIETSTGMTSGAEILDSEKPPVIIHDYSVAKYGNDAKLGKNWCITGDAGRIAVAYAIKHGRTIPEKSISLFGHISDGNIDADLHCDGMVHREGDEYCTINIEEFREDTFSECMAETLAGKDGYYKKEIDMDDVAGAVMVIGIENRDDFLNKVTFTKVTVRDEYEGIIEIPGCDGAIYATKKHLKKEHGWTTLGIAYSNMLSSLEEYEKYMYGDTYGFVFGRGEEMADKEDCYGYLSAADALRGAYDSGFGQTA